MNANVINELKSGLSAAYINGSSAANLAIFKKEEIYRIIIGSSNMTSAALTVNKEWNTKLISTESGEIAEEIVDEFQNLWNSEYALPYDDFYEVYKERYNIVKHQREIAKSEEILSLEKYSIC